MPRGWNKDGVAALLCGETIAVLFIANKAINGRLAEVSLYLIKLAVVCKKMPWLQENYILCKYTLYKGVNYLGV